MIINVTDTATNKFLGWIRPYVSGRVALCDAEAYVPALNVFMSCGMHPTAEEAKAAILDFHLAL